MAARNRLPPWHEHIRLSNGREVIVRPIRPADADPLRQGFPLLEPDEIRQRFLHAVSELTPDMADKLARPDAKREFALVAAEPLPPGEALVGAVARAAISDSGREAEFAILVSHYIAGMGLGRHLMRRLVRWAKGRKLERLWGDVLEHNQPMLALAQSLGFRREPTNEPGLVRVVLDLVPGRGTHEHHHEPKAA
jgi:RimJ/RimL family protein N-acetyltransferase